MALAAERLAEVFDGLRRARLALEQWKVVAGGFGGDPEDPCEHEGPEPSANGEERTDEDEGATAIFRPSLDKSYDRDENNVEVWFE